MNCHTKRDYHITWLFTLKNEYEVPSITAWALKSDTLYFPVPHINNYLTEKLFLYECCLLFHYVVYYECYNFKNTLLKKSH